MEVTFRSMAPISFLSSASQMIPALGLCSRRTLHRSHTRSASAPNASAVEKRSAPLARELRVGLFERNDVYFPHQTIGICISDKRMKALFSEALKHNSGLFAHVAIDPSQLGKIQRREDKDWIFYAVGNLYKLTRLEDFKADAAGGDSEKGNFMVVAHSMGRVEVVRPQLTAHSYWSTGLRMLDDWPDKNQHPDLVEAQGRARDLLDEILALGRLVGDGRGSERSRSELAKLRMLLENDTTRLLPTDSSSRENALSELPLLMWYSYLGSSIATGLANSAHSKRQQLLDTSDPLHRLALARNMLADGLTRQGVTSLPKHPHAAFK